MVRQQTDGVSLAGLPQLVGPLLSVAVPTRFLELEFTTHDLAITIRTALDKFRNPQYHPLNLLVVTPLVGEIAGAQVLFITHRGKEEAHWYPLLMKTY